MHKKSLMFITIGIMFFLTGCSTVSITTHTIQSFEIPTTKLNTNTAFSSLSSILIERGYDLKMSSKDSGVITTEYKKFYSADGNPPFDYYMQIRASIKESSKKGQTIIRLAPMIKTQNRLNSAAFTEIELSYSEGAENKADVGVTTFMNIVNDMSERAGVTNDQIVKNVSTSKREKIVGPLDGILGIK